MKSKAKFVSIESFSKEDLKALFEHICAHIIHKPSLEIKQDVLNIPGPGSTVANYNPTIQSILTLIATYDLKFEFTIKYVEKEEFEDSDFPPEPMAPIKKEMEKQRKEILPIKDEPSLLDGKEIQTVYVPTAKEAAQDKQPVNEDDLPEFN